MRQLYPLPAADTADIDIAAVYADLDWPRDTGLPRDRPFTALNMVSSADGRVTLDGAATGIGGAVDHTLLMRLRTHADALLYGSGTLRADGVGKGVPSALEAVRRARGLAAQPLLALLTASGDVPLTRALFKAPERTVVFVAERTPAAAVVRLRERATVRVAGAERPDPVEAMRVLRYEYGVRRLLCEGGPTINGALLAAALVDELFLTLAPTLLAGDGPSLVAGPVLRPPMPLTLRSLYEHAGELYVRYGIRRV